MSVCNYCNFSYDNLSRIPFLITPCCDTFCSTCLKDLQTCPKCGDAIQHLYKNNDMIPTNEIIFHNRYKKKGLIGSGQFGVVHKVFDIETKKEFALKELDRHRWVREKWTSEELQILKLINNRYIISFHDTFNEGTYLYILTEYCKGGDLSIKIEEKKLKNERFNYETKFIWVKQMIYGLHYLHSKKIIHRDLKPKMLVYDPKVRCDSNKLYEMTTSNFQEIRTLNGHEQGVKCLTVLKNGNLASCATDRTIKLWNPDTGELLKTLTGHTDYVWTLTVLDNDLLASGSWDKSIILWDTDKGLPVKKLIGHQSCVRCLAVLKNGNLVSGSIDTTIKIWNPEKDEAIQTINAHSDYVECLVVLHNGLLASCSHDLTIKIWDPSTGLLVQTLLGHEHFVNSLFVLPDGLFASCSYDETIKIWSSSNGSLNKTISFRGAEVNCLTLILNDILVVGSSKAVVIRSLSSEMIKQDITLKELDVKEIECLVHLGNDMFAVGLSNGSIKIWA